MKILGWMLTALSAVLAVLGVYLEKSDRASQMKARAAYIIGLAIAGGFLAMGILVTNVVESRADARQKQASAEIIKVIETKVVKIEPIVVGLPDLIKSKLSNKLPGTVGVRIASADVFHTGAAESKGTPEEWHRFRAWLTKNKARNPTELTYLTVRLNGSVRGARQNNWSRYRVDLLLAYLLTNDESAAYLVRVLDRSTPRGTFPSSDFLRKYSTRCVLDFVLFVDQDGAAVGFAHADALVSDLLAIRLAGNWDAFEATLNETIPRPLDALKALPSFRGAWDEAEDSADVVRRMMEQRINEIVIKTTKSEAIYVTLSDAIKLL